jgi:hypothetical protein
MADTQTTKVLHEILDEVMRASIHSNPKMKDEHLWKAAEKVTAGRDALEEIERRLPNAYPKTTATE